MVKCQNVNLQFNSGSTPPVTTLQLNINNKVFGYAVECGVKAAGSVGNDFFSAKLRFKVEVKRKYVNGTHFTDVTHIGKTSTPINKCGKYFYYYDINCPDSSSSDIIDDAFEQQVFMNLKSMICSGIVTNCGAITSVSFTLPSFFNYLVMHIKIGANEYETSSSIFIDPNALPISFGSTKSLDDVSYSLAPIFTCITR